MPIGGRDFHLRHRRADAQTPAEVGGWSAIRISSNSVPGPTIHAGASLCLKLTRRRPALPRCPAECLGGACRGRLAGSSP